MAVTEGYYVQTPNSNVVVENEIDQEWQAEIDAAPDMDVAIQDPPTSPARDPARGTATPAEVFQNVIGNQSNN